MSNCGIVISGLPQRVHTGVAGAEGVHEVGPAHAAAQGEGLLEPEGVPRPLADGRLVDRPEERHILPRQGAASGFCVVMDCQAHMGCAACGAQISIFNIQELLRASGHCRRNEQTRSHGFMCSFAVLPAVQGSAGKRRSHAMPVMPVSRVVAA